jgi:hypothetical protein
MKNSVELAAKWLLDSGIQSPEGGFFAWYNLNEENHAYVYSEITGYAITTLLFLNKILNDDVFLEKAKLAATWLISYSLHPCGGVRTRLYAQDMHADKNYSFSGENIFSFDTAMALYGMINLYKMTKEDNFLKAAVTMGDFLIDRMQNYDGSLAATFNAKFEKINPDLFDKWSNQRGSFHAKACLGFVDLFSQTQQEKYKVAAEKLAGFALTLQDFSGRFITNKADNTTHLHPHCYAAEGLFYAGSYLGIDKFIEASKRAVLWAFEKVTKVGVNEVFDPLTNSFNDFQRNDILAQVLRLGLIFDLENKKAEYLNALLLKSQYSGNNDRQRGGFLFSRSGPHVNSWVTMFAIQALAFYQNMNLIFLRNKIELLI